MKIEVNKFNTILLIMFFCLFENIFFIINSEENLLLGKFNNMVLLLFIIVISFISFTIKGKSKYKSSFSKLVIALIILTFISSFAAYKYVNQPILEGILQQRTFIMILLCYFPLRNIFLNEKI